MQQELTDYIVQAQRHGLSDFEIKQNLLGAGWDAAAVEESFVFAKAAENHFLTPKGKVTGPGETFSVADSKTGGLSGLENQTTDSVTFQPTTLAESGDRPFYKRWLFWGVIIALLALGGAAYGYYNFIYVTPQRVWSAMLAAPTSSSVQTDYTVSYTDPSATSTLPFSLSVSGSNQGDISDPANAKNAGNTTMSLKGGGISYSIDFNYSVFGQVLYLDLGDIAELKNLFGGQNIGWVKLDLAELQNYLKQKTPAGSNVPSQNPFADPGLQSQLKKIWATANIVSPTNFLAKEKINSTPVYHLQATVNYQALNAAVTSSLAAIAAASGTTTMTDTDKTELTAVINKFQVKQLDFWVGQSDHKVYKTSIKVSAPSVSDMSAPPFSNSMAPVNAPARDARRLADVRQMTSALELYHNDFGGYPASQNGQALNLAPTYIGITPVAPEPADGTCTDYYNGYWYKAVGMPSTVNGQQVYPSFTYTFCLGAATGGYAAGIGQLTPSGITGNIACPTTADQCVGQQQQSAQDFVTELNKLGFAGVISIDMSYSKFGQNFNLTPPPNPTDFMDLMNSMQQPGPSNQIQSDIPPISANDQRLTDIRELASAFELYFNDKNSYPSKLSQLAPNYIGVIPTAPTTDLGNCSLSDNTYTYTNTSPDNYSLTFCLGSATGGYSAGKHILSPAGIQ